MNTTLRSLASVLALLLIGADALHAQTSVTWTGATDGNWGTAGNWSPTAIPNSANATAVFGSSGPAGITLSGNYDVDQLSFLSGAQAYNFTVASGYLFFRGAGIVNASAATQTITVNSGQLLYFSNSASAGSVSTHIINNTLTRFENTATAGAATITTNNLIQFRNSATAGSAVITNTNTVSFTDTATAGSATITNNNTINFGLDSTAGSAAITNHGFVNFNDASSAGSASITNNLGLKFKDTSTAGSASVTNGSSGSLDLSGHTGGLSLGSLAGAGTASLGANALTVGGLNTHTTFSGAIADGGASGGTGGSFIKSGTGTLTLAGANSYTGATTVNAGTLQFGKVASLVGGAAGAANLTVASGATAAFNVGGSGEFASADLATVLANTGGFQAGAILGLNTTNAAGGNFSHAATITNTTNGALGLLKLGAGSLTLAGANTYAGTTQIAGGTLVLDHTDALGGSTLDYQQVDAGSLSFGTLTAATFGGLSGNKTLALINASGAAVALTVGYNNQATTYDGVLSGTGGLIKTGYSNLTLTGANTFTGGTTVSGGVLAFDTGGSIAGPVTVDSGLAYKGAASVGSAVITNNAHLWFLQDSTGGSAAVTNGSTGSIELISRTGGLALGSIAGGGTVRLEANTLTVGGLNTDTTFSGVIQDTGALVKAGTGTFTLTAANTYTGGTTVSAGTLLANNTTGSATGSGGLIVNSGATLGGSGFIGGPATIAGSGHLAPGNSPGTLTFAGGLTLDDGAILDFQLGAASDLIRISGGTLTGPASAGGITFNLANSGGFAPATYTVFDFTGASLSNFSASDFTLGTVIAGYAYSFALNGSTLELTASAIPEPSTYAAIFGAAVLGLAAWRRRRRAAC